MLCLDVALKQGWLRLLISH